MDNYTDSEIENPIDHVANQVESLLTSGEEASRSGDAKSALATFNKAISLDPSSDMAWFNRGVLLEAQQDARGARQAFQICLDVNPNHAPATANLCILLERIGDEVGAYNMAIKALEFYPGHPSIVEVKNRCHCFSSNHCLSKFWYFLLKEEQQNEVMNTVSLILMLVEGLPVLF